MLQRDAPNHYGFSRAPRELFRWTRRHRRTPIHCSAFMKRLACLHIVTCALFLTPFTTQSAEPPELEKGIAAAQKKGDRQAEKEMTVFAKRLRK